MLSLLYHLARVPVSDLSEVASGGVIGPPEEYSDIPRPHILITLPTQADHTDPIAT
jgi:hypothetical protein